MSVVFGIFAGKLKKMETSDSKKTRENTKNTG